MRNGKFTHALRGDLSEFLGTGCDCPQTGVNALKPGVADIDCKRGVTGSDEEAENAVN